jgi:uncharacterized membrane protein
MIARSVRALKARTFDPAVAVAVLLAGCFLTFFIVGFAIVPIGGWMLWRSRAA